MSLIRDRALQNCTYNDGMLEKDFSSLNLACGEVFQSLRVFAGNSVVTESQRTDEKLTRVVEEEEAAEDSAIDVSVANPEFHRSY